MGPGWEDDVPTRPVDRPIGKSVGATKPPVCRRTTPGRFIMIRQRRSLFVAPAVAALSGLLWAGSPARAADPAPNTRPNDPRPADSRDWVGNDEIRPGDSRARDPHDRDLR